MNNIAQIYSDIFIYIYVYIVMLYETYIYYVLRTCDFD